MTRSYLERLSDTALMDTLRSVTRSVNDIHATMIMDTMTDTTDSSISPVRAAISEIKEIGRNQEIATFRRISDDVMSIQNIRMKANQ
jgi:hypothetical protein